MLPGVIVPSVRPLAAMYGVIPLATALQLTFRQYFVDGSFIDVTSAAAWSSSNTSVVSVDVNGIALAKNLGNVTISATYNGVTANMDFKVSITAIPTPATAQLLVTAGNTMAPSTFHIDHGWVVGTGHPIDGSRVTNWTDFVGLGNDLILSAVSSFVGSNGAGLKYNVGTPNLLLYDGSSLKIIFPSDIDLSRSRWFLIIGKWNNDASNSPQIYDAGVTHQYGHSWEASTQRFNSFLFPGLAAGVSSQRTGRVKGGGVVACALIQYDRGYDELQMVIDRDSRSWGRGQGAGQTGLSPALLTLEFGNQPGGGAGNALTGDVRMILTGQGIVPQAFINLYVDFAIAQLGVVEDLRKHPMQIGNSIGANVSASQIFQKTRALLGDVNFCSDDLGISGATFGLLRDRISRCELFSISNPHRQHLPCLLEFTNSVTVGTTAIAAYNDYIATFDLLMTNAPPGTPRIAIEPLPSDEHATHGSANGLAIEAVRAQIIALMNADLGTRWTKVVKFGTHPIMGLYATLTDTTYYSDGVHPTSLGGDLLAPLLAAAFSS